MSEDSPLMARMAAGLRAGDDSGDEPPESSLGRSASLASDSVLSSSSFAGRPALVAIVGNPNAGKSSLFNALTGARQKIANYAGVTVERKSGRATFDDGRAVELVDLPGSYSLRPTSLDETVARDVIMGWQTNERRPDALMIVLDSCNLESHLRFTLELIALGLPVVVALNMADLAERDGLTIDAKRLERALGVPVTATIAPRRRGLKRLKERLDAVLQKAQQEPQQKPQQEPQQKPQQEPQQKPQQEPQQKPQQELRESKTGAAAARFAFPAAVAAFAAVVSPAAPAAVSSAADAATLRRRALAIAEQAIIAEAPVRRWTRIIDKIVLHPLLGVVLLLAMLFLMFQSVYAWAQAPVGWIETGLAALENGLNAALAPGLLRDFLSEAVLAGTGAVIVFLPQIVILFLFILILEATGYMARAAFLMDGLMAKVGLSGRSFIPLLSSFACAVPGIMATRVIPDQKDRLTTILVAPLMTCSARLPVYTLIIGAFIPNKSLGALGIGLQGLVLFSLYIFGTASALLVAWVLRRTMTQGVSASFMMELPRYQMPRLTDISLGLWQRTWIFLRRAGTLILATTVVLWLLLSFPKAPKGAAETQVEYSLGGRIAGGIEAVVAPIGFNRDIALALIPAMAAREVAVSALATANAIDTSDEKARDSSLAESLATRWSLATALAFLAWFVFAPQCISTIVITWRETGGWRWASFMVGYLLVLAYVAAGIVYWTAVALGLG